jgi:PAS domain S-box-containing protein
VLIGPDGAPQALVGVCHDVTDRAHAERALGASERRMRAIIDNTPSGICVKDLPGRYLMANAEYGRIAGIPADELVGRRCHDAFPPAIAEPQRAIDVEAATENEPVFAEAQLARDGEERSYVTVTFALPDDDGRPVETCTIVTDVTERRERESERRERLRWAERLTSALAEDRIRVVAQPVVDLATGACVSHELLSRLVEDGEVLAPAAFLPAAERFGLVQELDVHIIRRALALPDGVAPQVNLSAVTMGDAGARHEILEVLAAAPLRARERLVIEITETAAVEHQEAAREFAAAITALGCRLALDDFGTGFGSFTYLRALPLSYLKIDRTFVRDLVTRPDDRRVVQSIIGIAQQFGLMTIAEGVEDAATLDLLRELGADHAQGFHLGRPGDLPEPA